MYYLFIVTFGDLLPSLNLFSYFVLPEILRSGVEEQG